MKIAIPETASTEEKLLFLNHITQYYEVILDPMHPVLENRPEISWVLLSDRERTLETPDGFPIFAMSFFGGDDCQPEFLFIENGQMDNCEDVRSIAVEVGRG